MPAPSTVYLWLNLHSDFSERYARARGRCQRLLWLNPYQGTPARGESHSQRAERAGKRPDMGNHHPSPFRCVLGCVVAIVHGPSRN